MAKLVLTQRAGSRYDDAPGERYHFNGRDYLPTAKRGVGDWCLFYEPQREGRASYVAMARIDDLIEDSVRPGYWYLVLSEPIDFPSAVHYRLGEARLVKENGTQNRGLFGRSIREAPEVDFQRIIQFGFAPVLGMNQGSPLGARQSVAEPEIEFERPIVEIVTRRPLRDRAFAHLVRNAYDARCALTGMRMINGGGSAEAEAAHIRPVADKGPDMVLNGLALSRTGHWLFDRGYLALDDDYRILKAAGCPQDVGLFLRPDGMAVLPANDVDRPHPAFLRWHRENRFKGI